MKTTVRMLLLIPMFAAFVSLMGQSVFPPPDGGASLPATGNLIQGDGLGGATDSGIAPAAVATQSYAQGLVAGISTPGVSYPANQTNFGCGVEYISGLQFFVAACDYAIAGVHYTSPSATLTLTTADMTNPRIDAIIVDITGAASILTGTPAANPAQAAVDPSTQLQLTFAYVPANGTAPANVVTDSIYDEGSEWTLATTAHIANSTSNPYRNTHDVEATAAVLNNNFTLVKPAAGTVDLATRNFLVFYLRSKAVWPTGASGGTAARYLSLWWQNGSTQQGLQVVLRDGTFGFSSSNTTSYQQISIPTSLFGASGLPVTTLKVNVSGNSGSSSIGFYIDAVTLQGGYNAPALPATLANIRGVWSASTAYNVNDIAISSGGTAYYALVANTNVAQTTAATWKAFAQIPNATGCTNQFVRTLNGASNPTCGSVQTADITANAVTSAKEAAVNTRRTCDIAIGDTSGSALTNAQLGPQKRICYIPAAATIVEMAVAADGGTPNVIVAVDHAGSNSNIVSGALATASSGGIACTNTGGTAGIDGATTCTNSLQNTSIAAGDYLELVSGTAGGTAKLMTIHVVYTIN